MLLRDPAEAEDAAQQAFLSAYRSLLAGNEPEHPAAWLATIARNECRGRVQQRMRQPVPEQLSEEPASTLAEPLEAAMRKGELSALFAAISALPRSQRDALLLREFSGLSYAQLARALSVSEPAVESLLVRARRELRLRLQRIFAAGVMPVLALRDWLSRLGDGGESSFSAVAKLGSVTVAAKVAAGAATLTVVGGSVVADGRELARPTAAPERPPVRQTTLPAVAPPALARASLSPERRSEHHGRLSGESGHSLDHGGSNSGPGRGGGDGDEAPSSSSDSGPPTSAIGSTSGPGSGDAPATSGSGSGSSGDSGSGGGGSSGSGSSASGSSGSDSSGSGSSGGDGLFDSSGPG